MRAKRISVVFIFLISFEGCQTNVWTSFKRNVTLDGFNCNTDDFAFAQSISQGKSGCAVLCGMLAACLTIFYEPSTFQCYGCKDSYTTNEAKGILPGSLYYKKRVTDGATIKRGDSCYFTGPTGLTFEEAVAYCEENNAHVVQAETSEENTFLKDYFLSQPLSGYKIWHGLTDIREEGIWEWRLSGQPISTFSDWGNGEPDNTTAQNCVMFGEGRNRKWADTACSSTATYTLCEKRIDE